MRRIWEVDRQALERLDLDAILLSMQGNIQGHLPIGTLWNLRSQYLPVVVSRQGTVRIMSTTFMIMRNAGARNDAISGDAMSGAMAFVTTEAGVVEASMSFGARILEVKDGTISHHDAKTSQSLFTLRNLLFSKCRPARTMPLRVQCLQKFSHPMTDRSFGTSSFAVHKQLLPDTVWKFAVNISAWDLPSDPIQI